MLVIRDEQLRRLADQRLLEFERRLVAHCRDLVDRTGVAYDQSALEADVKRGLSSGLRFFRIGRDLARYCEIVLQRRLGDRVTNLPDSALEMLQNEALTPEVRLRNFERWAIHQRA